MKKLELPGADWLLPAGTDCTACSGSPMCQQTLRSEILTLIEALNTYNEQQTDDDDFQTAYKALFFARCMEGIKNDLTTHLANLEKRDFEELLSPDFFQIMKGVQWLKDTRLEAELLAMKDVALKAFGIDEEVDGHPTKTAADLYLWMEQNIKEISSLFRAIRKITAKLPPESFAASYEKQCMKIDMEPLQEFYNDMMMSVGKPTFNRLQAFRTRVVADFINLGVMRFALDSVTKEINEVDFERVKGELPPGYKFLTDFNVHCAVFRRMSRWEGLYLIIDKEDYGKYICLYMSKMTVAELLEFYKVEKLVAMINEAIKRLPMTDNKAETPKSAKVEPELAPVDRFVNRIKAIMMEAAKRNGERIVTKTRAWQGEYTFFVDGERIAKMMDDLRKNHEDKIVEFLEPYQRCDGVTVVAPFIGRLLDIEELRAKDLQKSDLDFAFAPYYNNGATAVKKMSSRLDDDVNVLFGTLEGLLRKYPATVFS